MQKIKKYRVLHHWLINFFYSALFSFWIINLSSQTLTGKVVTFLISVISFKGLSFLSKAIVKRYINHPMPWIKSLRAYQIKDNERKEFEAELRIILLTYLLLMFALFVLNAIITTIVGYNILFSVDWDRFISALFLFLAYLSFIMFLEYLGYEKDSLDKVNIRKIRRDLVLLVVISLFLALFLQLDLFSLSM